MTDRTEQEVLRRIEHDILDPHFKTFALPFRAERDAIVAVLRVYGQVLRDLRAGRLKDRSSDAKAHTANEGLRGLAHCVRWIAECSTKHLCVPSPSPDVLKGEALELLRWGVSYDALWNHHSAFSRGLIGIRVNESDRTISFLPDTEVDPRFFCSQIEAKKADDERRAKFRPEDRLAELSKEWFCSVSPAGGGLRFDDAAIRRSGAIEIASAWMDKVCLPELSEATALSGYSVGDLRRLLGTIYVYTLYITRLEDCSDDQPLDGVTIDAQPIVRPRERLVEWLADLSGVGRGSVDEIVATLTFDTRDPHVTMAQQPFVVSEDGDVFLLPRMIQLLDLPWTYVGAINRTKAGRRVYDRVINEIEENGVRFLTDEMRRRFPGGWNIASKPTFTLANGSTITPDIVLLSTSDHEVLVADVKYAAPPFGPGNVHRDIEEMGKWIAKMSHYVDSLRSEPGVLAQHFTELPPGAEVAVFGLILVRWPLPVPVTFPPGICAVDWPSLNNHLTQRGICAAELIGWARSRPDAEVAQQFVWKPKQISVGEWTYRYSVLTPVG